MSFPYITTSYENGASGYIVFSNKLCIQWGHGTGGKYNSAGTINLLKTYKNTNYIAHATCFGGSYAMESAYIQTKTTSSIAIVTGFNANAVVLNVDWFAIGYIA